MKRSFVPSENSDFSNNKRLKLSYNDYAEISYKFNASNAKSASTNDSDESQSDSMCELIKDIENFNLRRKNKINEMFYPKNEISKVKSSSRITNLTNNFNFSFPLQVRKQKRHIQLTRDKIVTKPGFHCEKKI